MNAALTALWWAWAMWQGRGYAQAADEVRPDRLRSLPFLNLTRNRPPHSDAATKRKVN